MRLLIVGDIMVDKYIYGETTRISPEAPIPILKVERCESRLGGAANVAANAKALGAEVTLAGLIGNDKAGEDVLRDLANRKIDMLITKRRGLETTTKLRAISQQQQLLRIDHEVARGGERESEDIDSMMKKILRLNELPDAIILSDYNKGALEKGEELIDFARMHRIPILIDPKKSDPSRYRGCTVLKPNLSEFMTLTGATDDSTELLVLKARELMDSYEIGAILLTLGRKGMMLIEKGKSEVVCRPTAREVYDVTGAGDTVIAAYAVGVLMGKSPRETLEFCSSAAGIAVSKLGTSIVSIEDIQTNTSLPHENKICNSLQELRHRVVDHRRYREGARVVFTNGCFDLMHIGHLEYLTRAKQEGSLLVVAINSDESVKHLKGNKRPICNEVDRSLLVAGIECVDLVLLFSEATPLKVIECIIPDVLVKGGDYEMEKIVGAQFVQEKGGVVKTMPLVEGRSTSRIIETINERSQD